MKLIIGVIKIINHLKQLTLNTYFLMMINLFIIIIEPVVIKKFWGKTKNQKQRKLRGSST